MTIDELRREEYNHERQRGEHAEEPFEIRFQRYTLRITWSTYQHEDADELEEIVQRAIQDAENAISDALPEGYYCKIEDA